MLLTKFLSKKRFSSATLGVQICLNGYGTGKSVSLVKPSCLIERNPITKDSFENHGFHAAWKNTPYFSL